MTLYKYVTHWEPSTIHSNDQEKKDRHTSDGRQQTTQKTKDRATRTPLTAGEYTKVILTGIRHVILVKIPVMKEGGETGLVICDWRS